MAGDSAALRRAAVAGHAADEEEARRLVAHPSPQVRTVALSSLARMGALGGPDLEQALADPHPAVRRRACELAVAVPDVELHPLLRDADAPVAEAAAWALGERGRAACGAVDELAEVARGHADALCREAAVAALGAIGDRRGLPAILAAQKDRPAVRRRSVIALAPFAGPQVEAALQAARRDRDWQVRQAAEDLLRDAGPDGHPPPS